MSRRDFLRTLQQLAHLEHHPMYNYGCMPRRNMRYFCTRNNALNRPTNPSQQNNPTHINESDYFNNHFASSFNSFNERQRQFIKEFDDLHRQYFNQLPLRRYAFHDQFSHLDKIFNQEFNRLRNSFLESQQKESQTSKQQQQQQQQQSEKVDNTLNNQQKTQQEQKVQAQQNKSETNNVEKTQQEKSLEKDPFFSFDSFFESPRYISDVHNLFHQEQQRLQKMIEQFETDFEKKAKENDPNVHTVRSYYKRTPEGETREYYDSKNPELNYKAEKKFEKPTLDSSQSKTSSTQEINQQCEQKTQVNNSTQSAESNTQTQQSAQPIQPKQEEIPQQQQQQEQKQVHQEPQQTASTESKSKHIDISPELNQKAKNLSLMLKKEYLECLELARVYPHKSVGQIIDMVIESEQYNKSY